MKKKSITLYQTIFLVAVLSFFSACKKENSNSSSTNTGNSGSNAEPDEVLTSPPTQFEAKAVIEMFGGEWCDKCPAGVKKLTELIHKNPGKVYGAIVHYRDAFETINYNSLFSHLGGVSTYPSAAVNRVPAENSGSQDYNVVYTKDYWEVNLNRFINKKKDLGLAIETSIENKTAKIKVHIRANKLEANADYKLTLYIIEDKVKSKNQLGADASYLHYMMLRGSLTNATGNAIALQEKTTLTKDFSLPLGGTFVTENLKILAFVNVEGGNTSGRAIVNAQQVKLGRTKNWD